MRKLHAWLTRSSDRGSVLQFCNDPVVGFEMKHASVVSLHSIISAKTTQTKMLWWAARKQGFCR